MAKNTAKQVLSQLATFADENRICYDCEVHDNASQYTYSVLEFSYEKQRYASTYINLYAHMPCWKCPACGKITEIGACLSLIKLVFLYYVFSTGRVNAQDWLHALNKLHLRVDEFAARFDVKTQYLYNYGAGNARQPLPPDMVEEIADRLYALICQSIEENVNVRKFY